MMRLSDRRKEVIFGLTLIVGVLLAAVTGEILMRIVEWQKGTSKVDTLEWAGFRKAAVFPSSDGEMERFIPGAEYRHIRINSLGFRGPEIKVPKPPGTIRIAFLGDSVMLGAELLEEFTISGATMTALERAFPSCQFDYVKVAGPLYTLRMLRDLLPVEVRPLKPDAYVLLAGTILETLREYQARNPEALHFVADSAGSFMSRYSRLVLHLTRVFQRERGRRLADRVDLSQELPDQAVEAVFGDQVADLAKEIGQVPVVAVAYRGMLRSGMTIREQTRLSQAVRARTRGLGPAEVFHLRELMIKELKVASGSFGWRFIDPVAEIPSDWSHYIGNGHFTAVGAVMAGNAIAHALIPLISAEDHACMAARTP